MKYYFDYNFEIGKLYIESQEEYISRISFFEISGERRETPAIQNAKKELDEYFAGVRQTFSIPLKLEGTEFQKSVWKELIKIPYGKTVSYYDIASNIGKPSACRAVGMANNKNRIAIVIPCHRVVGKNGSLTGYASGLGIKEKLLRLENSTTSGTFA